MKFFYNGIKTEEGLEKASFSFGNHIKIKNCIFINSKSYKGFSKEINDIFEVHNKTKSIEDYFEKDRIAIGGEHPLYMEILINSVLPYYKKCSAKGWKVGEQLDQIMEVLK